MAKDEENPYARWERNFRVQMQRLREAQGRSQTDLARSLRMWGLRFHQQTIQRIESGERPIRLNEAQLIADDLGVSLSAMTSANHASARELHYAVDRVRRTATLEAEQVVDSIGNLTEPVEMLVSLIVETLEAEGADQPDPETLWAIGWALDGGAAMLALEKLWLDLLQIGAGERPDYFLDVHINIGKTLEEWRERFDVPLRAMGWPERMPTEPPTDSEKPL